jgi:hypothetical protein
MPVTLGRKLGEELMYVGVTKNLQEHGLIKQTVNRECYKLTGMGRGVLEEMGFSFAEDARTRSSGSRYTRRLLCAEINVLFHVAGIDVFAENVQALRHARCAYLPSLSLRANGRAENPLAGARFSGILRSGDTAFVVYFTDDTDGGLHRAFEGQVFEGLIANVPDVKHTKIIFTGKSLERLWTALSAPTGDGRLRDQSITFAKAFEEFPNNVCLLERTRDGVTQAKIMAMENYRARLAAYMCQGKPDVPRALSHCDGLPHGVPLIVAVDMDLKHIYAALAQAAAYGREPHILCLSFQEKILRRVLSDNKIQRAQTMPIGADTIRACFAEFNRAACTNEPCPNTKGGYISVR